MTSEIITTERGEIVTSSPHPIDRNPAAVYLAGLGLGSRRSQAAALAKIANLLTGSPDILACNWAALRFQHTAAIRAKLAAQYAPATVNRILCALRGTLKAAWRLELMTAEDYHRARDLEGARGEALPAGRALSPGEIGALMQACELDTTPAGVRDAALIACLYPGGLRREEVVRLDLGDYSPGDGALTVRHGKRNKARHEQPTRNWRRNRKGSRFHICA